MSKKYFRVNLTYHTNAEVFVEAENAEDAYNVAINEDTDAQILKNLDETEYDIDEVSQEQFELNSRKH